MRPVPKRGLRAVVLDSGALVLSYEIDPVVEGRLEVFPPVERQVVLMMLEGMNDAAIAKERGCSRHTVSNLLRSAYARVGVTSRFELAALVTCPE